MKKFLFFTASTLCCLLLAVMPACKKEAINEPQISNANRLLQMDEQEALAIRHDRINVDSLLSEQHDIFGNVLVFNSMDEVDELLDSLSEMTPVQLRSWYDNAPYTNAIIESNIIYDSVYDAVAGILGIDFDGEDPVSEDTMDFFNAEFVAAMTNNHSNSCIIGDYYDEYSDTHYPCVNPIGDIDWEALCNENGLFIVDKVVFKIADDHLINCPIDRYADIAEYEDVQLLLEDIQSGIVGNINYNDIMASKIGNSGNDQFYNESDIKYHSATDGHYCIKADIVAYPYWLWQSRFMGKRHIENLYNGSKFKCYVEGSAYFGISANYDGTEIEPDFFIIDIDIDRTYEIGVAKRFKSKNWYHSYIITSAILNTNNVDMTYTNAHISLTQYGGDPHVVLNYNY